MESPKIGSEQAADKQVEHKSNMDSPQNGSEQAADKQVEDEVATTFLGLGDDCLWHMLGFLSLKDLASMQLTCTRLEALATRMSKLKNKKINISVKDYIGSNGEAADNGLMIKRFCGLSSVDIDFDGVTDYFESCETVFKYLCEHRSHPMEKLEVSSLKLRDGMPPSMSRFFRKIPVGELTFKACTFGGAFTKPELDYKLRNVLCLTFTDIQRGMVHLDVFRAPHVESLVIESASWPMVGVGSFIGWHHQLKSLEVKKCDSRWDFNQVLRPGGVESFRWFSWDIKNQYYDLQYKPQTQTELYFRDNLHFKVDYTKRIIYDQTSMQKLAKKEDLYKLQLNAGDIYWSDIFEPLATRAAFENYLVQLYEESSTLKEIELGFLDHRHVYRFSRDAYERFLAISKARNRKLTITFNFPMKFRLPWPITKKFGINTQYLRQNEKHLEIIIKFERTGTSLEAYQLRRR